MCRTRYGLNRAWTQRRCGVSYCQTLAAILAIMLLFASAFACAAAQGCPSVEPTLALEVLVRASSAAFKVVIPSSVSWWEKKVSSSAPKTGLTS